MGFFSELKNDLAAAVVPDKSDDDLETSQNEQEGQKVDLDSLLDNLDNMKLGSDDEDQADDSSVTSNDTGINDIDTDNTDTNNTYTDNTDTDNKDTGNTDTDNTDSDNTDTNYLGTNNTDFNDIGTNELNNDSEAKLADEQKKDDQNLLDQMLKNVDNDSIVDENDVDSNIDMDTADSVSENDTNSKEAYSQEDNKYYDRGDNSMSEENDAVDETATITKGMKINGDIETAGSLDLMGNIVGDVNVKGKLNITGVIEGNSTAAEIFADSAKVSGDMKSSGAVKVGQGTVVIGNLYACSAVVAGAVKGNIDVKGPVILDSTAIVMGNIKSESVQINNGAVIQGMCSQEYAKVNPTNFFENLKEDVSKKK